MRFDIRLAKNGAILRIEADNEAGSAAEEIVYQEADGGEIEAFAEFLRAAEGNDGPTTSRYSPKRIRIIVEPGDKYEGTGNTKSLRE
jgi:hypothetical protein